jgi:DNA-binding transcriptional regulator YiaG
MGQHWTPARVQALRLACGDNTAAFAARFARSRRSIEDWEQGRRNPDPLCQRVMDSLAVQISFDSYRGKAV